MLVQLPVRWSDHKRPSNEEATLRRLLKGEEDIEKVDEDEIEHVYGSVVMDTKDIRAYNDLDDRHCILRTYANDSYCVALSLDELKAIMVELTGQNITVIQRRVPDVVKKENKKPKKKSDEDDLII